MRTLLLSLFFALLTGCSSWGFPGVYRINVEQGNIITQEMVDQIKPGMTRRQVRFVLGTPLLEDPFHSNRWEYIYMLRNGNNTIIEDRLTVFFEGDTLVSYNTTLTPSEPAEPVEANPEEEKTYWEADPA
ncbi:MAG: outer membrane protein assembly factor BamE [Halieaceae bacterium]